MYTNGVIVKVKFAFLTDIDITKVNDIDDYEETKILDELSKKLDFDVDDYVSISELEHNDRFTDEETESYKWLIRDLKKAYPNAYLSRNVIFLADAQLRFEVKYYPATYWEPEDDNYTDMLEVNYDQLYNKIESELKELIADKNIKIEMLYVDYDEEIGTYDLSDGLEPDDFD